MANDGTWKWSSLWNRAGIQAVPKLIKQYPIRGLPAGDEAWIGNFRCGREESWRILRLKNGAQGDWTGNFANAQEALDAFQKEFDPFYIAFRAFDGNLRLLAVTEEEVVRGFADPQRLLEAIKVVVFSGLSELLQTVDFASRDEEIHLRSLLVQDRRQKVMKHLVKLLMARPHNSAVRCRAAQAIGIFILAWVPLPELIAKSIGTTPADTIFYRTRHTTSDIVQDVDKMVVWTAVGVMAANGDETAIKILCDNTVSRSDRVDLQFARIEALAAIPDTRCCAALLEEFHPSKCRDPLDRTICRGLIGQIRAHGPKISNEVLSSTILVAETEFARYEEVAELRSAAIGELQRRRTS